MSRSALWSIIYALVVACNDGMVCGVLAGCKWERLRWRCAKSLLFFHGMFWSSVLLWLDVHVE